MINTYRTHVFINLIEMSEILRGDRFGIKVHALPCTFTRGLLSFFN